MTDTRKKQEGYKGKTRKIQRKDIKDTRKKQDGYKGKTRKIQGKDMKDTSEKQEEGYKGKT